MNRSKLTLLLAGLCVIAVSGAMLYRFSTKQKLGKPGLKATAIPGSIKLDIPLPVNVLNYTSIYVPPDAVTTNTLPADTSLSQRLYTAPEVPQISMNVVLMGTDRTSIHKPQYCLLGQGWRIESAVEDSVSVLKPHPYSLPLMKITASREVEQNGQRMAVKGIYVYWFVADNVLTADHWQRMWWMSRELVTTGVLQRWAYVSCFSICLPGQEEATYELIKRFIASAAPEFQVATGAPPGTVAQRSPP